MKNYQSIENYKGSMFSPPKPSRFVGLPEYMGIEYNKNTPDGLVVSSPGGVASVFHHPSLGFYGQGGSTNDKYAGDGSRYLYGEYGNLYNVGDSASTYMGNYPPAPDYKFTKNESFAVTPSNKKKGILREMFAFPSEKQTDRFAFPSEKQTDRFAFPSEKQTDRFTPLKEKQTFLKEKFSYPNYSNLNELNNIDAKLAPDFVGYGNAEYDNVTDLSMMSGAPLSHPLPFQNDMANRPPMKGGKNAEGFEMIGSEADLAGLGKNLNSELGGKTLSLKNPVLVFIIFLIAYMALDFWAKTGNRLVTLYFGNGGPLTWKQLGVVALSFTVILIILRYFLDFPLITFEQL